MLTCKDATRLVSEHQDRALSLRERIGLRMHLWMCVNCRRFERQIGMIRKLLHLSIDEAGMAGEELSPEARERIRKALSERDDASH